MELKERNYARWKMCKRQNSAQYLPASAYAFATLKNKVIDISIRWLFLTGNLDAVSRHKNLTLSDRSLLISPAINLCGMGCTWVKIRCKSTLWQIKDIKPFASKSQCCKTMIKISSLQKADF